MQFGKENWRTFEHGIEKEWLVTNGLGGYASATLIGANSRKYHGLLIASLKPPVQRTLLLAKLDEEMVTKGVTYNLASNQTVTGVTESGFVHLQYVEIENFPLFVYTFADVIIYKQVFMIYGENTTVIQYHICNGEFPSLLKLKPLANYRDFHWTTEKNKTSFSQHETFQGTEVQVYPGIPVLKLYCNAGSYEPENDWFYRMFYIRERERGLDAVEDHYMPGCFTIPLNPDEEKDVTFIATVEEKYSLNGKSLLETQKKRIKKLITQAKLEDELGCRLVQAADAFIVYRHSTDSKSIIAGYHWFNDWGRDAMIALPGITLVTGRFGEAREILLTFARYCQNGLLPNMFPDTEEQVPLYNTVDASLWFFQSVYKYLQYTGDYSFVQREIYDVLKVIVDCYIRGTHFNIKMDEDGLISAGSPGIQLTWMDARVDDWVVTPRHGKPVEINALWYNALYILKDLAQLFNDCFPYPELPAKVKENFSNKFWYETGSYLYDVINGDEKDSTLRPNQVIALSLTHTMLDSVKGRQIIHRLRQELYATYGLRSLTPAHSDYKGVYAGNRAERDGAYHQGTAWSWLIGPFITGFRRVYGYSEASRKQAARFIVPFMSHLRDHGVGFVSEIFDGNEPVNPRGCIAQAWGVAEVLRAYVEDILERRPLYEGK